MHYTKTPFSLSFLACLIAFAYGANAAPSVRVLGSGAGYSVGTNAKTGTSAKAVNVAKTGNTIKTNVLNSTAGATKAASVRTISAPKVASVAPTPARIASSKATMSPQTAVAKTSTERFPGVMTKSNIQSVAKVGNTTTAAGKTTVSAGGYNVKEMDDRLRDVEHFLDSDVATTKLSDYYYTKDEIDNNYFTAEEVQDKIDAINVDASSRYIQGLREDIDANYNAIDNLRQAVTTIETKQQSVYDSHTGQQQNVYFVNTFDENSINWDE